MDLAVDLRRSCIEANNSHLSINRQLCLASLSKSGYYYEPREESKENLEIMEMIDKIYTKRPVFGSRKMVSILHAFGYIVNRKRVIRLMQNMGLRAVYPEKNLSKANKELKWTPKSRLNFAF